MDSDLESIMIKTARKLAAGKIDSPRLEARMLIAHVLGIETSEVRFCRANLDSVQQKQLKKMLKERLSHKPLDKIFGTRGFYKYDFEVSSDVLSPRPDTEVLVEVAVGYAGIHCVKNVLDLGVGSGCILLSILADCPELTGVGVDVSRPALEIARRNAHNLNVADRVKFVNKSWAEDNFHVNLGMTFDMIVSNPPYIPSADIPRLGIEVRKYDPLRALDGGSDGLREYRRLASEIPLLLNPDGIVFLEVGIEQAEEVARIFCAQGLKLLQIIKDLGDVERCVILKK